MKRCPPLAGAGGGQLRLIIKGDGYFHFMNEVILKDKIKEKAVKEAGYEVMRFTDKPIHPQPPPAGDIAIAKVSAKKDILSSEE